MLASAVEDDETLLVPLDALRIGLMEGSDENEKWNARTLALMARSGLIQITGAERIDGRSFIGVALRRTDLQTEDAWRKVDDVRRRSLAERRSQLARVMTIARGAGVCDALVETYTVPSIGSVDGLACRRRSMRRLRRLSPVHDCGRASDPTSAASASALFTLTYPVTSANSRKEGTGSSFSMADKKIGGVDYARVINVLCRAGVRHVVCDRAVAREQSVARQLRELVLELGMEAPLWTGPDELAEGVVLLANLPTALLIPPGRR